MYHITVYEDDTLWYYDGDHSDMDVYCAQQQYFVSKEDYYRIRADYSFYRREKAATAAAFAAAKKAAAAVAAAEAAHKRKHPVVIVKTPSKPAPWCKTK